MRMRNHIDRCREIMKELKIRDATYNSTFFFPSESFNLKNYDLIIQRRIDLKKIEENLNRKAYKTTKEWYDDVCLVFKNAKKYYSDPKGTQDPILVSVAEHRLNEFEKLAYGLNVEDSEKWAKKVKTATNKLTKLISTPPILFKESSKLKVLYQNAERIPDPNPDDIDFCLDVLNDMSKNSDSKDDLYSILYNYASLSPNDIKNDVVDLEKLNPYAVKLLVQYAKDPLCNRI